MRSGSDATTSAAPFELTIPPAKMLTSKEELTLLRQAVARNPESRDLRFSLAAQLVQANEFEELIALLDSWNVSEYRFFHLQAEALLSRETETANRAIQAVCLRTLVPGQSELERAGVLTVLAKACTRLGELDEARAHLREALTLNAHDKDAYKRTVALEFQDRTPENVLHLARKMVSGGITHSRVLCSQTLALARLGMMEEARQAQGLDQFLACFEPAPPAGFATLEEFNRELAEEVANHPDIRYNRYGTASAHTWRIDEPSIQRSRLFPVLQQLIAREIEAYVAGLGVEGHPFLAGRPAAARLRNWCVITEGDGHETWHVHQNGWLSGTYYIQVPDHIAQGTGREGCIAFGLPEEIVGEENALAFGETLIRPRAGLMTIFPSHIYHRTYPHHGTGRRICYAFDTIPLAART